MTIPAAVSEISHDGNGVTLAFAIPFVFDTAADLKVTSTDSSGNVTTLTTGFSITGGGGSTGTVTFTSAPASGVTITVLDQPEFTQPTDYSNNDAFAAESHENALDRVTRLTKRLYQLVSRSVRTAEGDPITDLTLGSVDNRKGKYLFFNAVTGAIEYAAGVVTTTLTQSLLGQLLNPQTAEESAAGVTPTNYWYRAYNLKRYGGVGNNSTINNTAIANWKAACDQADAEGVIPDGTFKINADVELPKKVTCYGYITGAFNVLYQKRQNGWVEGLKCDKFKLRGCFFCTVSNLYCLGDVTVDGYDNTFGTFWNEFPQWRVEGTLTIDITNWAVNLNAWRGGRIDYTHITGNQATYAGTQAHANTFDGVDFTNGGVLQDDTAYEVNFIQSAYFEDGATINGNFHLIGFQGDAFAMPPIARFAHILGAVGRNSRVSRDFLSLSVHNAARGGAWDWIDSSSKPPCLSITGGAGTAVSADTSEPGGTARRYEATFSAAFSGFSIQLQPNGTDRFGLCLFYRSAGDFATVESNDGSGAISHSVLPVTIDSNWKMLRIAGPASKTAATTVTLYAYGAGGGSAKFMAVGSIFAGGERAVLSPHKNHEYESGVYTPTLTSVANLDASTPYPMKYSRIGNTVHVSGRVDIDPTANTTLTRLGISLPIAPTTAFSQTYDLSGVANSRSTLEAGGVLADTVNARAELNIISQGTANHDVYVEFSYRMG